MQQNKQIIKLFWSLAVKYPVRAWASVIMPSITSLTSSFVGPFIISIVLGQLQNGSISLQTAWPLILAYLGTQLFGEVIGWRINLYTIWTMEVLVRKDLYERILTTLSKHSMNFHNNRFSGALVSQSTKLVGSFERFWDTLSFQLIPSVTSVIAAVTILSFIFWQYAVVLAILSIAFIIIVVFGSKFMAKRTIAESKAQTKVNAYLADNIANINAIKSHGRESFEINEITAKAEFWRQKSLSTMRGFLGVSSIYSSMIMLLNLTALTMAIIASESGTISISIVYLAVTYTFTVARQLWEVNGIMRSYHRIIGDAHEMTEILRLDIDIKDNTSKNLKVKNGNLFINKINFTHKENTEILFDNLTLNVKAGEKIGLVGKSGAGKTTIASLILRFSELDGGQILIDNQDIKNITQKSLRENIAYIPQEPLLFHRTLAENIAYGKPNASEEEIIEAAEKAHAMEFIKRLPLGLDTLVGERGVKLSGGQRQRIAIARAILKNAPILILDEATSALDSESESKIQASLNVLMKGRTSIVIAHRLSTIAKLDRIIVLDDGKIIEDGTHDELIKQNGTYSSLWKHQSGGFIQN